MQTSSVFSKQNQASGLSCPFNPDQFNSFLRKLQITSEMIITRTELSTVRNYSDYQCNCIIIIIIIMQRLTRHVSVIRLTNRNRTLTYTLPTSKVTGCYVMWSIVLAAHVHHVNTASYIAESAYCHYQSSCSMSIFQLAQFGDTTRWTSSVDLEFFRNVCSGPNLHYASLSPIQETDKSPSPSTPHDVDRDAALGKTLKQFCQEGVAVNSSPRQTNQRRLGGQHFLMMCKQEESAGARWRW